MLASLLARYHRPGEYKEGRYDAWTEALRRLRADCAPDAPPKIAELPTYLEDVPKDQRNDVLEDLISEHLRASWRVGPGVRLETYGEELGAFSPPERVSGDLVVEELLARYQLPHGDMPSIEEYRHRFSNRPDVIDLVACHFLAGERYVILQKLGLGGMGDVSRGYDRRLRRMVAIKQPRLGLRDAAQTLRDFAEETSIAAGLEHPGIVSVHEYHEDKDSPPFYVMPLVAGQTLSERIRDYHYPQSGQTPPERQRQWHELIRSMLAIVEAISYAHTCGVLHCDLKPGNIMVGEFGETVIVDWGMARRIASAADRSSQSESTFREAGTPEYMAPEQVDGKADERSDVFGLGAVLYELLTGSSPHGWADGVRPVAWRECVRRARFEKPRRRQPRAARALEAICLRALEPAPERRYQTAADLAQDLKRYLSGEALSIHQGRLSRIRRWMGIRC